MQGFITNIEDDTQTNEFFRKVLYTAPHSQLVVMALPPGTDIGMETHAEHDQFIRVESGTGKSVLNGEEHDLSDGSAVVIPAGTEHNIVNTGSVVLKLYTIYTPPEHKDGTVHKTKEEAMADEHNHETG